MAIIVSQFTDLMVCVSSASPRSYRIGRMVDDGAPNNAIGNAELCLHRKRLTGPKLTLEPLPSELNCCQYWQFGSGEHTSPVAGS